MANTAAVLTVLFVLARLCEGVCGPGEAARRCEDADFTSAPEPRLNLATVKAQAGARVHFFKASATCPDGPASECRGKAFLVPGDAVAVAKHHAGFACAWYQRTSVNDAVVGWLPAHSLDETPPPAAPPVSAWVREWSRHAAAGNEATLTIRLDPDGQSLQVSGLALWMSTASSGSVPHVGEVEGRARPQGNGW